MLREPSYAENTIAVTQNAQVVSQIVQEGHTKSLRFWGILLKSYLRHFPLIILSVLAAAGSTLYLGHALRFMIDTGFAADSWSVRSLVPLGCGVIVLALASFGRFYSVSWLGERIIADIRARLFGHLLKLDPLFYETKPLGDVMSSLTVDTTLLQVLFGTSCAVAIRNCILLIGGLVMMVLISPRLTWIMGLMVPLVAMVLAIYGRYVRQLARQAQTALADVAATSQEALRAIQMVQAFRCERNFESQFSSRSQAALLLAKKRIAARGLMTMIVILLVSVFIGVVIVSGGYAMNDGQLTSGQMASFLFYALIVAGTLGSMGELMGDVQRALGATDRILGILHSAPREEHAAQDSNHMTAKARLSGTIEFEHVFFAYSSRPQTYALEDVSFVIHAGERVAIVGPSGAGKSTLFQLLLRFYDPSRGDLRLDGISFDQCSRSFFREAIGWVPQDPEVLSATIAENIAFGNPSASLEQIQIVARLVHADSFIKSLPNGYNTFVGEKGVCLSGGQRQRLALARALLVNPAVLLLDEATSALDSESESEVQKGLAAAMAGRTSLVIAHRLSTVMDADRILVIDQGRVVASGRHHQLLQSSKLYARLAARQFSPEKEDIDCDGAVSDDQKVIQSVIT